MRGLSKALSLLKIVYHTPHLLLKPSVKTTFTAAASPLHIYQWNCRKKVMNIHSPHGPWLCTGLTFHQRSRNLNGHSYCKVRVGRFNHTAQHLRLWSKNVFCLVEIGGKTQVKGTQKGYGFRLCHGNRSFKWKRKKRPVKWKTWPLSNLY